MAERRRTRHDDDEPKATAPRSGGATMVTYRPEPGDPVTVEWDGLKFEANVPREVSAAHKDLIASAKGNPWFEVEGHPRAKRVKPTGEAVLPPGHDVDPVALDDSKMVEED